MIIARILGTVVASQKDERLKGGKLLIVKPLNLDGTQVDPTDMDPLYLPNVKEFWPPGSHEIDFTPLFVGL